MFYECIDLVVLVNIKRKLIIKSILNSEIDYDS